MRDPRPGFLPRWDWIVGLIVAHGDLGAQEGPGGEFLGMNPGMTSAQRALALTSGDVEFKIDENRIRPEKSEVFRLWCDNKKLVKLTGFKPQIDIKEGIQKTVNWYLENRNDSRRN